MAERNALDWTALVLVIVCGINVGIIGLANVNVVGAIIGTVPILVKILYILTGLSALYMIYYVTKKE